MAEAIEILEEWRDIPEYEDMYQVSNFGNIKNKTKTSGERSKQQNKTGYVCVVIRKLQPDGKKKYVSESVHRLVAKAFLPNPDNKPTVNHKNHIRNDNRLENLEWATYSEQNTHSRLEKYKDEYTGSSYQPEATEDDVWIPTVHDDFHVSNTGKVKNIKRNRIKYIAVDGRGYCSVIISKKGYTVHRLVARAFLPNYSDELVVNHIDGNKSNNHLSNLECVTQSQNIQHSYAINKYENKKRTAVIQVDVNENIVASYKSMTEAENMTANSHGQITVAINNNSVVNGFKWYKTIEDFENDRPNIKKDITATYYKVFQYTVNGELIAEFDDLVKAEAATGISRSNISRAVNGKKDILGTAGGFIWTTCRVPKTDLIEKLLSDLSLLTL